MFLGAREKPELAMVTYSLTLCKSRLERPPPLDAVGLGQGWKGLEPPFPGHAMLSPLTHPESDGHSHSTSACGAARGPSCHLWCWLAPSRVLAGLWVLCRQSPVESPGLSPQCGSRGGREPVANFYTHHLFPREPPPGG